MKAKYIIVEHRGIELPIVFNSTIMQHDEVARAYPQKAIAAGFCNYDDDGWACWGESISLKLKSRLAKDSEILNRFIFPGIAP